MQIVITSDQRELFHSLKAKDWNREAIAAYLKYESKKKSVIRNKRITLGSDSQRSKTYSAEFAYHKKFGYGKQFDTIKDCQKYTNKITNSATWKKLVKESRHEHRRNVSVETLGGHRFAGMSHGYKIRLNTTGMNEYVILHELAHSAGYMHHDVGFRICLLKLVSRFLGREQAQELKSQFKARKLKVTISNHIKSPEQWLKTYERLESARAARAA
jgi:predicted metal-dependent hydrolase